MSRNATILFFIIVLVFLFAFFKWRNLEYRKKEPLDRNNTIVYSKEANCLMNCQQISKRDIERVIEKGIILYHRTKRVSATRSQITMRGFNDGKENLEVVIQPSDSIITILSVINLKKKTNCSCL